MIRSCTLWNCEQITASVIVSFKFLFPLSLFDIFPHQICHHCLLRRAFVCSVLLPCVQCFYFISSCFFLSYCLWSDEAEESQVRTFHLYRMNVKLSPTSQLFFELCSDVLHQIGCFSADACRHRGPSNVGIQAVWFRESHKASAVQGFYLGMAAFT